MWKESPRRHTVDGSIVPLQASTHDAGDAKWVVDRWIRERNPAPSITGGAPQILCLGLLRWRPRGLAWVLSNRNRSRSSNCEFRSTLWLFLVGGAADLRGTVFGAVFDLEVVEMTASPREQQVRRSAASIPIPFFIISNYIFLNYIRRTHSSEGQT